MSENNLSHTEAAQTRIEEIRAMRDKIPNFTVPKTKNDGRKLVSVARIPPEFIELTAVAVKNSAVLVRQGATDPDQIRDLMTYADAYLPLADELEALARFIRHSVASAKHKAGTEALTTYALTQRLARRPDSADLMPLVVAMRDALGRKRRKAKSNEPEPAPDAPTPASPETSLTS